MANHSEMTLREATEAFLENLQAQGKKPRTLYTYGKDCEQIIAHFGPDKRLINLMPAHIARFYKSDELLKIPKNGKERSIKTINKTKMVLKLLLQWAKDEGHIDKVLLPK